MRILLTAAITVLLSSSDALATSCSVPPVCNRIRVASVLFTGVVADPGMPGGNPRENRARVTVREAFAGLAPDEKELVVATDVGWRLDKGVEYLFDVDKGRDNTYRPTVCGSTGEAHADYNEDFLKFLRLRAEGKTSTSFTVGVSEGGGRSISGVEVTARSGDRILSALTDSEGLARFPAIESGTYLVSINNAHYEVAGGSPSAQQVVAGACNSAFLQLTADTSISGRVLDAEGKAVRSLQIELTRYRPSTSRRGLPDTAGQISTNQQGEFRFEAVPPGKYLIGTNIFGLASSDVPPTYYPSSREQLGAVPVSLSLGESVSNLIFRLPDYGPERLVRICVVSQSGMPEPNAQIKSDPFGASENQPFTGIPLLTTDMQGCASAKLLAGARYAIHASQPGKTYLETRSSESQVIPPGSTDLTIQLALRAPLSELIKKRQ